MTRADREPNAADLETAYRLQECNEQKFLFQDHTECAVHDSPWPCEVAAVTARALVTQRAEIHARYEAACVEVEQLADQVVDAMPRSVEIGSAQAQQMAGEFAICNGMLSTVARIRQVAQ